MLIVSFSFDDGQLASTLKTARIYEKFGLGACFNVPATGMRPDPDEPDAYHEKDVKASFKLWNELQARGHDCLVAVNG